MILVKNDNLNLQLKKDSLKFIKSIPKKIWKQIDFVVWDPPYYDEGNPEHEERFNNRRGRFGTSQHIALMDPELREKIYKTILSNLHSAAILEFHSKDIFQDRENGYPLLWYKKKTGLTGGKILPVHEFMFLEEFGNFELQGRIPYVLEYPNRSAINQYGTNGYRTGMKPSELYKKLFQACNSKFVLDVFAGMGGSIQASLELGIKIWACDLDPDGKLLDPWNQLKNWRSLETDFKMEVKN